MNKTYSVKQKSIAQFNEWASSYDEGIWSLYFKYSTKKALSFFDYNDSLVLDLACGTGNLCLTISETFSTQSVVGVDLSTQMIAVANAKKSTAPNQKKLKFMVGDAEEIPFGENSFDFVFCMNCFHHFPDHNKVAKEINRVLKEGGKLIFLDACKGGFIRLIWTFILRVGFKERYARYYSREDLNKIFTSAGLMLKKSERFLYFAQFLIFSKNHD